MKSGCTAGLVDGQNQVRAIGGRLGYRAEVPNTQAVGPHAIYGRRAVAAGDEVRISFGA